MVFLRSHAWIEPPFKLIRTYKGEGSGLEYGLYNFVDDSREAINLFRPDDARSASMREKLQQWLDANNADFPAILEREGTLRTIDPATLEMLRSLGYIY
jgi:hypothetical protein